MNNRRIITTDAAEEDVRIEGSLRPQSLEAYIGQEKANLYPGGKVQRGGSGPCAFLWTSGAGKDHPGRDHCQ